MNLPELVLLSPFQDLLLPNLSATAMSSPAAVIFFSLWTIFSVLHKQDLKYPLCLAVCHPQLVTSLHWQLKWVSCRNALPLPKEDPSHQFRLFMCRLTTLLTPLQPLHSHTLMPPRY